MIIYNIKLEVEYTIPYMHKFTIKTRYIEKKSVPMTAL